MFYPNLIERYEQIIIDNLSISTITKIEPDSVDQTSLIHLLWMLQELSTNTEQSTTKKHRWLGYIQGILISKNYTTVSEEREFTRSIFKGD